MPPFEDGAPAEAGGGQETAPAAPMSVRDSLEASFDEIEARAPDEAPAKPGPGHNGGPELDHEAPASAPQPRASDGKFAPRGGDPNAAAPKAASADDPATPPWLAAATAVDWKRLPRNVQENLASAVQQATSGGAAAPLSEAVRPYEAEFRSRGLTPEIGVRALLDTWSALNRDPETTLNNLARQFGLVPNRSQQQPQPSQQPYDSHQASLPADPQVRALHSELQEIKGQLTAQQQAQFQAQLSATQTEIDRFAKDEATPRPHFEEVAADMALLIQTGRADALTDAYELACWLNPKVRAAIQEDQRKADEVKRTQDAAKRASEAKRAAVVNVRSTPGTTPKQPASIRDSLAAAFDAITATP